MYYPEYEILTGGTNVHEAFRLESAILVTFFQHFLVNFIPINSVITITSFELIISKVGVVLRFM